MSSKKTSDGKDPKKPSQAGDSETIETKIDQFDQFLQYLDKTYTAQDVENIPIPRDAPSATARASVERHEPLDTSINLSDVPDEEEIVEVLNEAAVIDEIIDSTASESIEIEASPYDVTSLIETMEEPLDEQPAKDLDLELPKKVLPEVTLLVSNNSEKFAHNYLFARFPITYVLILVPQAVAMLVNIFFEPSKEVEIFSETTIDDLIKQSQYELIDNYLLSLKLTLTILLAFFLCYRWSTMQNDGSYGYWLTQGANRRRFFLQTTYKFLLTIYAGSAIGIIFVFYLNGINLGILTFITLNILLISHILVLVSIGILIGNTVKNPKSAALIFIVIFAVNALFNQNEGTIWHKILQSDLHYRFSPFLALISAIGLAVVVTLVSLRIHLKLDLEL